MGKDPAFLFYANDWAGGTSYFSIEEKGAYLELLLLQFQAGRFTTAQAKQVLITCYERVWPTIASKFETDGSFFWNEAMLEIKEKRMAYTESRKLNRLGKNKKHINNTRKTYVKHMGNGNENRNVKVNKEMEIPFKSEAFKKAWDEWLTYRGQRKLKTTDLTIQKQLKFLGTKTEAEAISIIDNSIQQGYQGLFEPKSYPYGTKSKQPSAGRYHVGQQNYTEQL